MAKEKYSYGYAQEKYKPLKCKEEQYNLKLKKGNYYIIRFDGKEMTAAFKIDHKAINEPFFDTMEDTFNEFCKTTQNVIFGYSFSDEISIFRIIELKNYCRYYRLNLPYLFTEMRKNTIWIYKIKIGYLMLA